MAQSAGGNRRLYGVAILIPLILLAGSLALFTTGVNEELRFTRDELAGIGYVAQVHSIIRDLQEVRGLGNIESRLGEPAGPRTNGRQRRIHKALSRLAQEAHPRFPEFSDLIRRSHRSIHRQFVGLSSEQDPEARFAAYTESVQRLRRLVRWIADRSGLVLDPERRTYYLMRLYVDEVPSLVEALGRLRGVRSGLLVNPGQDREAGQRLRDRVVVARGELEDAVGTLEIIGFLQSGAGDRAAEPARAAATRTRGFLDANHRLPAQPLTAEAARAYFDAATAVIERWVALNAVFRERLVQGLEARHAALQTNRLLGASGIITAMLVMLAAFTAFYRRESRTRRRLEQETDLSTALLQSLPGLFFLVDEGYRLLQWNHRLEQVTGHDRRGLRGRDLTSLFDPDERSRIDAALQEGFRGGSCELDARLVARDGPHRWFHFTGSRAMLQGAPHLVGFAVDIGERKRMEGELRRLASTDALTGLYNRPRLEEYLDQAEERHQRSGSPYALVMFDVDHFKAINDRYGHDRGDAVLRELARTVAGQLRATDILARWGGEEFMVLAQDSERRGAVHLAERIRAAVEAETFSGGIDVTVSVGVAAVRPQERRREVLKRVDQALYTAKEEGRNRVACAPD